MLRTVKVTRYVTPLREGGSLPAIVEADDDGTYVLKFRGAGQGPKALIAELIGGLIGRQLGLPIPEVVLIELDPILARNELDPEIQALIKASGGLNLALDYLPGSITFDPLVPANLDPLLTASIVWFDAFITNVDRTPRNTNMLIWHKKLWLIDHGAALYFHHSWPDYQNRIRSPFAPIKDHVLLRYVQTQALQTADQTLSAKISQESIVNIVQSIPDSWLEGEPLFASVEEHRAAYIEYLTIRLAASAIFVKEIERVRAS